MSRPTPQAARRLRRGLSLPEALISLSISALLLVATAAAYQASTAAVETNDQFFKASQAARVSIGRMTTEVRRAFAVQMNPTNPNNLPGIQITRPADQLTANEQTRWYLYDAANKRIVEQINYLDGTNSGLLKLVDNVTSASFTDDTTSGPNQTTIPLRVAVKVTVQVGANQMVLDGCATPRQYLQN